MSTSTSKAPSIETIVDLLTDALSVDIAEGWSRGLDRTRGEAPSTNGGSGPDVDGPYGFLYTAPALAMTEAALAQRIADEVGVTKASGFKYLRAVMDHDGSPIVSIDVRIADGSIVRVANVGLHDAIRSERGERLSIGTAPKITSRGHAQPPDVRGHRLDGGYASPGKTERWVTTIDAVTEHVQREQAHADAKSEEYHQREARMLADFDALYPGLRKRLSSIVADPDREGFFRSGNHYNVMRDETDGVLRLSLTVSGEQIDALQGLLAEAWQAGAEATAEWAANNPGPSGIPSDPPSNPYEAR